MMFSTITLHMTSTQGVYAWRDPNAMELVPWPKNQPQTIGRLKIQSYGCAILITDHNFSHLFDVVDRAYVLGEQAIIAKGTPSEIMKSSKAIELYFGKQYS